MEELKREIENAWKLLSMLPVSGDAVDVLAACRMALRRAMAMTDAGKADRTAAEELGKEA